MYLSRPDGLDEKRRGEPTPRNPINAGLTIIELLVALSLASVVMFGVYSIYSVATETYRIQDEVMSAMDQTRFGLEQIKRDVSRAAFLATPNSIADPLVCPKPANDLKGIVFERGGDVAFPAVNVNIQPTSVILFGSFWSSDIYLTRSVVGNIVTLQTAADGAPYPDSQAEFDQIFRAGRYLRIMNAEQYEGYYLIDSANFGNGEIQLQNAVAMASPPTFCGVQGFGVGLTAAVVGHVRYRLVTDATDATGAKIDLVRHEISSADPTLQTVIADTGVVIAENVVDLQFYDFIVDTDRSGRNPLIANLPHIGDVLDAGAQKLDNTTEARPQDLRFVTVKLTTRTEHEDEKTDFTPRAALFDPIDSYEVDPAMVGAARTVSLASRIELKSMMVRNVK